MNSLSKNNQIAELVIFGYVSFTPTLLVNVLALNRVPVNYLLLY